MAEVIEIGRCAICRCSGVIVKGYTRKYNGLPVLTDDHHTYNAICVHSMDCLGRIGNRLEVALEQMESEDV
jgi:hypothetical protein